MLLTRHQTAQGMRWANDGFFLPEDINLSTLLSTSRDAMIKILTSASRDETAIGETLAPVESMHEVWAAGVTYQRSREARQAESAVADVYDRVYVAPRPELFFKSIGWRVVGDGAPLHIRSDSKWNVPEPELVLVINRDREIVGYTAGNDMSSRDIEGENPLYLPQAKIYNQSCAIGSGILICDANELTEIPIRITIRRQGAILFQGETTTAEMKRSFTELVTYLTRELVFPHGVLLMTGTGLVPPDDFSLRLGDLVEIQVGKLAIQNQIKDPKVVVN